MDYRPHSFLSAGSGSQRLFTPSHSPTEYVLQTFDPAHIPPRKQLPQDTKDPVTFKSSTAAPLLDADDRWASTASPSLVEYEERNVEPESHTQTSPPEHVKLGPPHKPRHGVGWWWWWEIASATLSIACMSLILALLLTVDETTLESWSLPIQPNTIIAVLTTVGKSAMMVPIAAGISQLKWQHFERRNDGLHRLQVFDDASRGPFGSAMLIIKMPTKAILAWGFAFVTVVALGIDPSAQQILDFPLIDRPIYNLSLPLGRAENYYSKAFLEGPRTLSQVPNPDLLKLQSSIVNGAAGDVFQPNFNCPKPAKLCTWEAFITLGVCSTFENLTSVATHNCSGDTFTTLNCTYDFPGRSESEDPITMSFNKVGTTNHPGSDIFRSNAARIGSDEFGGFQAAFTAVKVTNKAMGETTPPATEVLRSTWYWCAQTFSKVTASPTLNFTPPRVERLHFVEQVPIDHVSNKLGAAYQSYMDRSREELYNITTTADIYFYEYLRLLLTRTVIDSPLNLRSTDDLNMGFFLYTSDLAAITERIALTMTNQIRSQNPGDNANATTISGTARFDETHIQVRWPWLILPMAEAFATAVLLALTIVVTRSRPVLKESVIAYLAYGMDERAGEVLRATGPQTGEEMEDAAKGLRVRLLSDYEGRRKFVSDR